MQILLVPCHVGHAEVTVRTPSTQRLQKRTSIFRSANVPKMLDAMALYPNTPRRFGFSSGRGCSACVQLNGSQ